MDSASQIASEISKAISEQKEELNDRNRSVNLLQKALVSYYVARYMISISLPVLFVFLIAYSL